MGMLSKLFQEDLVAYLKAENAELKQQLKELHEARVVDRKAWEAERLQERAAFEAERRNLQDRLLLGRGIPPYAINPNQTDDPQPERMERTKYYEHLAEEDDARELADIREAAKLQAEYWAAYRAEQEALARAEALAEKEEVANAG